MLQAQTKTVTQDGFYDITVTPSIGGLIRHDDRDYSRLLEGDDFVDSGYGGSQFRVPTGFSHCPSVPLNITITGRTIQRERWGGAWVRIKIEWVNDCEPNTFTGGWLQTTDR